MNWAKGRATRGRGTSFKGALLYVLHDKGASTDSRVGRIALRNLATARAGDAWREMMTLCEAADDLKRRAGGRATGRKLAKPVYAFTLNWHEDDAPDVDHMLETAEAALKILGMQDLQAVIVEHTDTAHRHMHIIVNLIDPATGKTVSLSNDDHKLDRWADAYEVSHRTIRSPDRRAKFAALDAGQKPGKRPQQASSRSEWEARKARGATIKAEALAIRAAHAARVAQLKAQQADQERARTAQRQRLWHAYQNDRKGIQARYKPFIDAIYAKRGSPPANVKAGLQELEETAEWKAFGQKSRARKRSFSRRERSGLGRIVNIVSLYTRLGEGRLTRLFLLVVSPRYRAKLFDATVQQDKLALRTRQSLRRKRQADTLRAACRHELGERATAFRQRSAALRQGAADARAAGRAEWRRLNADCDKTWAALRAAFDLHDPQKAAAPPDVTLSARFAAAAAPEPLHAEETDSDGDGAGDANGVSLTARFAAAATPNTLRTRQRQTDGEGEDGRARDGKGGSGGGRKSKPRRAPREPRADRPWSQRRSAAERKQDGSYNPRDRGGKGPPNRP